MDLKPDANREYDDVDIVVEKPWLGDIDWAMVSGKPSGNPDWRAGNPIGLPRIPRNDPQVSVPEAALGVNLDVSPRSFEHLLLQTCCPPGFSAILTDRFEGARVSTLDIPDVDAAVFIDDDVDMGAALDEMHARGGRFLSLDWNPARVQGKGVAVDLPRNLDEARAQMKTFFASEALESRSRAAFSVLVPVVERRAFASANPATGRPERTWIATMEGERVERGIDAAEIRASAARILEDGRRLAETVGRRISRGDGSPVVLTLPEDPSTTKLEHCVGGYRDPRPEDLRNPIFRISPTPADPFDDAFDPGLDEVRGRADETPSPD
jgi:hypothetical protein